MGVSSKGVGIMCEAGLSVTLRGVDPTPCDRPVEALMDTVCVHCRERISLGPQPRIGQRVACSGCQACLEVISLSPIELDWAYDGPASEVWGTLLMQEEQSSVAGGSDRS
jgi:hypothetical protein